MKQNERNIKRHKDVVRIAKGYDKPRIGIFASHSALETGAAAKSWGFETVLIAEEGREGLYTVDNPWLYDHVIILKSFADILNKEIQERLIELNVIFIPNRSFSSYVDLDGIENDFGVPMYGSRFLLRTEERDFDKGQYYLMEKAGIRMPRKIETPGDIDRLSVVKVQQANNRRERAFFYPTSLDDYEEQALRLLEDGVITEEALRNARIEEFVLGPRFNADFHSFALKDTFGNFGFVGFSDRRQVNIGGLLNLPAREQLKIDVPIKNEEIGHMGITMRESKKPLAYEAAKRFIDVCLQEYPPGMIGMFGLQGAVAYSPENKLEFVIFDVSPRVPGDPAIGPTSPEMRILSLRYGRRIEDPLDLTMMEIEEAYKTGRLGSIVT